MTFFTYDDQEKIERLYSGTSRYKKVTDDYVDGEYDMVTFADIAPNVTYYSPKTITIEVGGKGYLVGFEEEKPIDRAEFILKIADYILTQQPTRTLEDIRAELETVVPSPLASKWKTPQIAAETKAYAISLHHIGLSESRMQTVGLAAGIALVPPLIVLLLGTGVGWALTGFRRTQSS